VNSAVAPHTSHGLIDLRQLSCQSLKLDYHAHQVKLTTELPDISALSSPKDECSLMSGSFLGGLTKEQIGKHA
jgi:hypothetical protein